MSQHARRSGRRRGIAGLLLLSLAATVVAGCRPDAEDDDAAADRARSRAAVQESAQSLLAEAEAALPARAADPVARWQGCTSSFPEGWAEVRWTVEARLDVSSDARARAPYLAPLRPVLERAGFDPVTRAPGHAPFATLEGEHDGLAAAVTHTGAGRFVLVTVRGDCVAAGERLDGVR